MNFSGVTVNLERISILKCMFLSEYQQSLVILSDQIDGIPFLILCFSVLLVLNLVGLHRNNSASYI